MKYFNVTILSLQAVLFWAGNVPAMTITEFDQLNDESKGDVVSTVLKNNVMRLVELKQDSLAACTVALFKNKALDNGQVINVGWGIVANQIDIYRDQDPDNTHVEKIVDVVFKNLLKNECIPDIEKQSNDVQE